MLHQCDATIVHNVTLRWFADGRVTYHLAPILLPQLRILSAPRP